MQSNERKLKKKFGESRFKQGGGGGTCTKKKLQKKSQRLFIFRLLKKALIVDFYVRISRIRKTTASREGTDD